MNWNDLNLIDNIVYFYNSISQLLSKFFDKIFPMWTKRIKKLANDKSYFDSRLRGLIKEKHKLEKLYVKKPTACRDCYKECRNRLTNEMRADKRRFYGNFFRSNDRKPKKIWSALNG